MGSKHKPDLALLGMTLLCIIMVCWAVHMVRSQSAKWEEYREKTKDQYVLLGSNSLGCKQYSYNEDIVWKCPEGLGVSQIGREVCGVGKQSNNCHTVYDPVINK